MKRSWQPEELIEHWTLIPTELDLLTKKTATNRLGIALLLKYFQYEGKFPTSKAEVLVSCRLGKSWLSVVSSRGMLFLSSARA